MLRKTQCYRDVRKANSWLIGVSLFSALSLSSPTFSQETPDALLDEIVVTAQKREQELFEIPIAISAFSGSQLERSGISDLTGLTEQVPGLEISPSEAGGGTVFIRGIGTAVQGVGADPNVAIYRDGVYVSRHALAFQDFIDIDRVEVLRGPQGTLYGRNATGGAINIISNRPGSEWRVNGRLEGGRYDKYTGAIAAGGPVVADRLWVRGSYVRSTQENYVENVFDPSSPFREKIIDSEAFNGSVVFEVTDNLEVALQADYEEDNGFGVLPIRKSWLGPRDIAEAGPFFGVPQELTDDRFESNQDFADTGDAKLRNRGAGATVTWDFEGYTLKSISGYRRFESTRVFDNDGTNAPIATAVTPSDSESFSQEVQLLSPSGGKFEWILGAFYYDEKSRGLGRFGGPRNFDVGLGELGFSGVLANSQSNFDSTIETEAWAIFAQGTYNISDQWRATLGLRYSDEEKSFQTTADNLRSVINQDEVDEFLASPLAEIPFEDGTVGDVVNNIVAFFDEPVTAATRDAASFDAFTPRVSLEWLPNQDYLFYAAVSKGFKSGGFNALDTGPLNVLLGLAPPPASGNANDAFQEPYDEEELWSYETGMRATLMDGRMRLAGTVFYYDYDNLQVQTTVGNPTTGFQSLISNDASADILGLELELVAEPIERLQVALTAAWTDGEYDEFDNVADAIDAQLIDLSGSETLRTPEHRLFASAQYNVLMGDSGILIPRIEVSYESDQNFLLSTITSESDPRFQAQEALGIGDLSTVRGGEHTVVDLSLSYVLPQRDIIIRGYVDNVFDETYRLALLSDSGTGQQEILARGREYGVTVSFNF